MNPLRESSSNLGLFHEKNIIEKQVGLKNKIPTVFLQLGMFLYKLIRIIYVIRVFQLIDGNR